MTDKVTAAIERLETLARISDLYGLSDDARVVRAMVEILNRIYNEVEMNADVGIHLAENWKEQDKFARELLDLLPDEENKL